MQQQIDKEIALAKRSKKIENIVQKRLQDKQEIIELYDFKKASERERLVARKIAHEKEI